MSGAPSDAVDHYAVLGLASGPSAPLHTLKDIAKAYHNESRKRHPDKRPDDPLATADFQLLTASYNILIDPALRAKVDARIAAARDRGIRDSKQSAKRRTLASDLDERERAAETAAYDSTESNNKRAAAETKRDLDAFMATKRKKPAPPPPAAKEGRKEENGLDTEKMLKVKWAREDGDYTAAKLRELFGAFGAVEDVVIQSKKEKGAALVVMGSKESAVAATRTMSGRLSNPLLVLPFRTPGTSSTFPEPVEPKLSNIVGAGLHDYEASVLKRLQEAHQKKQRAARKEAEGKEAGDKEAEGKEAGDKEAEDLR